MLISSALPQSSGKCVHEATSLPLCVCVCVFLTISQGTLPDWNLFSILILMEKMLSPCCLFFFISKTTYYVFKTTGSQSESCHKTNTNYTFPTPDSSFPRGFSWPCQWEKKIRSLRFEDDGNKRRAQNCLVKNLCLCCLLFSEIKFLI